MGVVFVRRNKVGWMLSASFAGDTVRSDYSRTPGVAARPAVVLQSIAAAARKFKSRRTFGEISSD